MTETVTLPTPDLAGPRPPAKWDREYEAFLRLLPGLLPTHRGQFVAVHDGRVIGHGPDKVAVARAAYAAVGVVEILVRRVTDEPPRVVQLPSVRVELPGAD